MNPLVKPVLFIVLLVWAVVVVNTLHAQPLDPLKDYSMGTAVVRNADGTIARSSRVTSAYRRLYACPSTLLKTGACPGWSLDHVRPLDCGGLDSVSNLTWMDNRIKSCAAPQCKDRYERIIYGGRAISKGCP